MNRYTTILITWLILFNVGFGQKSKSDKEEKKCVVCHVQWHENRNQPEQLIPKIETNIFLDGRPAIVSHEKMCLSCHDGYVLDSREVFSSANHRGSLDKSHLKIQDLPMGQDEEIYCGTCHTPHALKPKRRTGLAPFLREKVTNSKLCLDCHSDEARDHKSHPIHVSQPAGHNMPRDAFFGNNNQVECLTCHPMHRTQVAYGVREKDRSELCSACHDSYFNIELTDHDLPSQTSNSKTMKQAQIKQDVCATCHSSHDGVGNAMWTMEVNKQDGDNGYCLGCHSSEGVGNGKAFAHTGHPVAGEQLNKTIPSLGVKSGDQLLCVTCHDPHQWDYSQSHTLSSKNEEGSELTSFLRLPDDELGQLCTACHTEMEAIARSDHSAVRSGFQEHFKTSDRSEGQCSTCHETHAATPYNLIAVDSDGDLTRALCESCHDEIHIYNAEMGYKHPLGVAFENKSNLPTYQGQLTCITCHDPHQWGVVRDSSLTGNLRGVDANSFLRVANWPEPGLCLSCHENQQTILETDHDLSDDEQNACSVCHSTHEAQGEYGILSVWDANDGETYNERFCFSCHREGGSAAKKIPEAWTHPQEYGTITHNLRGTGEWIDFPLFDQDKPNKSVGFVDCFTCHDTHKWSFNDKLASHHSENDEGDFMTSFLRNPSKNTLCTDCHGVNTLWKYKYYHDPLKRKRY